MDLGELVGKEAKNYDSDEKDLDNKYEVDKYE